MPERYAPHNRKKGSALGWFWGGFGDGLMPGTEWEKQFRSLALNHPVAPQRQSIQTVCFAWK